MASVDVYYNLHKGLWSLKCRNSGRVIEHARVVFCALPVALVVQPSGHRQAVETGIKNVHAFVRGSYIGTSDRVKLWQSFAKQITGIQPISYNPQKGPSFYRRDTGAAVSEADSVVMIAPDDGPPYVGAVAPH